ncbi:MAG: hypothetical protein ACK5XV_01295 [Flavobacteriales bacterium]
MNPAQHQQVASLMERLSTIQHRMACVRHMFPNHYNDLQLRYNQMLVEAREARIIPPWMSGPTA